MVAPLGVRPEEGWQGICPQCGQPGVVYNVREDHFVICPDDLTCWDGGRNLYSGWADETPTDWERNAIVVEMCTRVNPVTLLVDLLPTARESDGNWAPSDF
jgi:hypothetical protein